MIINFYDLNKQDKKVNKKILNSINKIIKKKNFINGDEVSIFEKKFARFIGSKYSISCSNGTDALTLSLKALNLNKNSEVLIPAMTYVSTAFAVINANLKPVLIDIDLKTGLMNLEVIQKYFSKKTKVIIPVHLYGNILDISKLNKLKKKLIVIDDASQAHGGKFLNSKYVGLMTHASCFSLYPGKNLGAYGDAGVITTNKQSFRNKIIKLSNLGADRYNKYNHELVAFNNRLDTIQASVLIEKIKYLKFHNKLRREIANKYLTEIKNKKITLINYSKNSVFHQFVILTSDRKQFMRYMDKNKIQTAIHYPKAIHEHRALKKMFKNNQYPNASRFAKECVSIPIDPYLKKKEVDYIIKIINSY